MSMSGKSKHSRGLSKKIRQARTDEELDGLLLDSLNYHRASRKRREKKRRAELEAMK
jgi:hypothetical protein